MSRAPQPSASLVRAVQVEDSRLHRALEVLEQRRAALRAELASVDRERAELQARRRLLAEVAGNEAEGDDVRDVVAHTQIRGRELRRVAGRLLWRTHRGREIHYREWFERVLAAGYAVTGKDPAASFLTNVRDSPAVARGVAPGHYRIDPEAGVRIDQARAEVVAEIEDVQRRMQVVTRDGGSALSDREFERLRSHRQVLKATLRRLESEADEIAAIVAEGEDRELRVA